VQSQIEGHFETCPTMGHIHEVNLRDKTVAALLIDNLRVHTPAKVDAETTQIHMMCI
jgi:hypothetical protein